MKCKICEEEKDNIQFYKNCNICKKCRCFQTSEWRKNNKDKVSLARKIRRKKEDRELFLQKERDLYKKNHQKNLDRARKWRENNVEKTREATKKWQKNNKDKILDYQRKNRDKQREYGKRWREKHGERAKEIIRKNIQLSRNKFPEKNKARKILFCAVRVGYMTRPMNCSKCLKECKPEGHHPDYSKPLEVIWLCIECHNKEHGK